MSSLEKSTEHLSSQEEIIDDANKLIDQYENVIKNMKLAKSENELKKLKDSQKNIMKQGGNLVNKSNYIPKSQDRLEGMNQFQNDPNMVQSIIDKYDSNQLEELCKIKLTKPIMEIDQSDFVVLKVLEKKIPNNQFIKDKIIMYSQLEEFEKQLQNMGTLTKISQLLSNNTFLSKNAVKDISLSEQIKNEKLLFEEYIVDGGARKKNLNGLPNLIELEKGYSYGKMLVNKIDFVPGVMRPLNGKEINNILNTNNYFNNNTIYNLDIVQLPNGDGNLNVRVLDPNNREYIKYYNTGYSNLPSKSPSRK